VTTLVICIDRSGAIGRATNVPMPVAGWEAVRSLVTDAGLSDPEDASVNCLLESLRVARDLRDEREEAVVAVVSAESDTAVGADRSIAAQLDDLVDRYDPRAAIVVVDSAEDEQVLPIVESRIPVDSVDRVVVGRPAISSRPTTCSSSSSPTSSSGRRFSFRSGSRSCWCPRCSTGSPPARRSRASPGCSGRAPV